MPIRPNDLLDAGPIGPGPANALAPQPTWADAAQYNAPIVADAWRTAQTPEFWREAASQYGNAMLMGSTTPGMRTPGFRVHGSPHAPIEVSGGYVKGQPNIIRFSEDADAIQSALPAVPEGHTRLWRGNRPDEVGTGQQFTSSLEGIALPFREQYGGPVSYVDVPSAGVESYLQTAGAAPGVEFFLPPKLAGQARSVYVTPRTEPGARAATGAPK